MRHLFNRYVEALNQEIYLQTTNCSQQSLSTIFFGGGTPTLLSTENLTKILAACEKRFRVSKNAEISIEMNPKTVDFTKLLTIKELGINRVSVGVQSFSDTELQQLGRLHSAQEAFDAVTAVHAADIGNISIDLMSGLPGQSVDSWRWSLESAISLRPDHLSLYQLSVERGTKFFSQLQQGTLSLPDEEELLQMDQVTLDLCENAGFQQYEISNFAQTGFDCRHNINYWRNGEYFAVGAGAVRYLEGERIKNIENPTLYCEKLEKGESVVQERETLDLEASFRESVVLGLRMVNGVSSERLLKKYGIAIETYYGEILARLLDLQLLEFKGNSLRLTKQGRALSNQVMADLV
jgi:oxygen-independent coproporphyrinogen III oxidase